MGTQRKMDHEDGPYGGQFGGGGPEIPSGGWSQHPGFDTLIPDHYYYEYPPHMGKMEFGRYGARSEESDIYLTNIQSETDQDGRTHHTATDQHGRVWEWAYESNAKSDAEKDWEIGYRDTDGWEHQYYTTDDGTWAEDHGLEAQNLAQDYLNPFSPDGQVENLGQDHLPPPSPYDGIEDENLAKDHGFPGLDEEPPVEETAPPAPVPGPEVQENYVKDYGFPGLVEEPPTEQSPPAEPPVQPNPPPPDHGLQENLAKDHGFPGLGVEPRPSVIGQPSLGEEDPAPPGPDSKHQAEERARAEEAQNPTPPADPPPPLQDKPPVDPNADRQPPEEPPPSPSFEDLGIEEHHAKDYDILPDLLEEPAPAPPMPDPEPMHTLNPELLDPTAPGATLDHGLVEQIEQSPELVEAINHNQDIARALEQDPTQIEQIAEYVSLVEPSFGVAEPPAGVTGEPFANPSLTEENMPEPPGPTGQDLDDLST